MAQDRRHEASPRSPRSSTSRAASPPPRPLLIAAALLALGATASAASNDLLAFATGETRGRPETVLALSPDGSSNAPYIKHKLTGPIDSFNAYFRINPNSISLSTGGFFVFLRGHDYGLHHVQLKLYEAGSQYKIRLEVKEDTGGYQEVGYLTLDDDTFTSIRLEWTSGDGDGSAKLYKYETKVLEVADLDNDTWQFNNVRIGFPQGSTQSGGNGSAMWLDDFLLTE